MKLRVILIILSLMAFFSAWSGGYLYYSTVKKAALEEARNQAVFHTETIKSHLSYSLKENLKSVRALSGLLELSRALSSQDAETLEPVNDTLDHFKTAFRADICYLVGINGTTIASSNRNSSNSFVGQNYAFRPYFKNALEGNPSRYSGYLALGVTSEKRGIYYSYPVYGEEQDQPVGVAVIKTSIDPIEKEFVKEYDGTVMLIDPNGIIFMSNRREWVLQTFSKLSSDKIKSIEGYRQFGKGPWKWSGLRLSDDAHALDKHGNKYLFHKMALEKYPGWHLVFLSDINSILKRVKSPIFKTVGYLVITFCVFVGLVIFILYQNANREIIQRMNAEKALRAAHNDLEKRVLDRTAKIRQTVDDLQNEIVERERVERALRRSETKYRTLTNNLSVGVFRTMPEPQGMYIDVNSALMKIFGFDNKEALLSLPARKLYQHPEDRKVFSNKMLTDGYVKNEVFMLKKKDGTPFLGSVTAVAVKDRNGEVTHYDGILEDITEFQRVKQQAQKRLEEITHLGRVATMGELSASIAHELNQPLAAILTNAQAGLRFIEGESPDIEELRDILNDIASDDRRAGKVIQRLRSLFRKEEFKKIPLDINTIVQEVVSLINSEVITRNVSMETSLDTQLSSVPGDKVHLQQVIINFILNASDAMEEIEEDNRKIVISTEKTMDNMVKVGIHDNGTGFDEEKLNSLTEPFYTTKTGGMGMGLSINRTIIRAHSGRMWAVNKPDKGAIFYFTLPIVDED